MEKIVVPFRKVIDLVGHLLAHIALRQKLVQRLRSGACSQVDSFGRAGNNEDVRLQKSVALLAIGNSAMEKEFPI